jgi:UDP-N-acetylmuramoylalanine--D-glutamate ligase
LTGSRGDFLYSFFVYIFLANLMEFPELVDKKIAILGYGREGKSTLAFLLKHGVREDQITILDKSMDDPIFKSPQPPFMKGGEDYLQGLNQYDVIFKTAGIPYSSEIQEVADSVTTQVQFFFNHYQGKVIAITASKGKTTMTSLVYQLLLDAGYPVVLAGNI